MKIPVMRGLIDRRILVNFRVDPQVLSKILPKPFRAKLIHGFGMVGICLIRLKHVRPKLVPSFLGIWSENAAHRIAVEWDEQDETKEGVFIPRRDTSSKINALVGGRVFPGEHNHSVFQVQEKDDHFLIILDSNDGATHLLVDARVAQNLPSTSVFKSLDEASNFFKQGSLGYSVTSKPGLFDGLELNSFDWKIEPLTVDKVETSFFEDPNVFPPGTVQFDCALLMRGIEHEWIGRGRLSAASF